jgi:hypothetical protein
MLPGVFSYSEDAKGGEKMRVVKQLAMLVLGFALVGGAVAYADFDFVFGDFNQTSPVDKFKVTCGGVTEICAFIEDDGPFNDNIFGVNIKCIVPKQSPTFRDVAVPGGDAEACVSNCSKAKVELRCDKSSFFCDDDYFAVFDCDEEDITVEQTGNGNQ